MAPKNSLYSVFFPPIVAIILIETEIRRKNETHRMPSTSHSLENDKI